MSDLLWFVAHTRPRCEKKLKWYCDGEKIPATLPCYRTIHKYRGKTVTFEKPLFPGYVFVQLPLERRQIIVRNDCVAKLLDIYDQNLFVRQLGAIMQALDTDLEVFLAPEIGPSSRARVRYGPLRGMEGWVESRYGSTTILLRLEFIGQAAGVKLQADQLELI
jgi:transcription antitermination factor NusG